MASVMLDPHIIWKLDQQKSTLSVHADVHVGKVPEPVKVPTLSNVPPRSMGYATPYLHTADALMGQESERTSRELDRAMAEWDEARALCADIGDASPESKKWLMELQKKVEDLEDKLCDLQPVSIKDQIAPALTHSPFTV